MEPMQVSMPNANKNASGWEGRFVEGVIQQCADSKGVAARLRRADNLATEYQSWELLAHFGVNLEHEDQRLPFVTVAAAIAKAKMKQNGTLRFGQAIAACYEDGRESEQAKARMRRLLACDDLPELCRILRPLFSLIDSKASKSIEYIRLLRQLRRFPFEAQQVKAQWAQEFYGQPVAADTVEVLA